MWEILQRIWCAKNPSLCLLVVHRKTFAPFWDFMDAVPTVLSNGERQQPFEACPLHISIINKGNRKKVDKKLSNLENIIAKINF